MGLQVAVGLVGLAAQLCGLRQRGRVRLLAALAALLVVVQLLQRRRLVLPAHAFATAVSEIKHYLVNAIAAYAQLIQNLDLSLHGCSHTGISATHDDQRDICMHMLRHSSAIASYF